MKFISLLKSLAYVIFFCGCVRDEQPAILSSSSLSSYDLWNKKPVVLELPKELREISGIVVIDEERLFAHNDELGVVYQVDLHTGSIEKYFSLGKKRNQDDFEDIAVAVDQFFLVSSDGKIYRFTEGENNSHVKFELFETGLSARYEVEGLCFDPDSQSLLLACKGYPGKGFGNARAVYSFSLKNLKLEKKPRFVLLLRELRDKFGIKKFQPTGITRNPMTGTFFLLSSNESSILELSSTGEILGCVRLPTEIHRQPEGIAFSPDGTLLISNEGHRHGFVVKYPLKK
ncbi:MAG: SdiA-regulated domain-containing protein [Ignavibacteriae bacterium]|nr:SdiA-regulated domain-containing protein [Ignavibacteriota bacterium]